MPYCGYTRDGFCYSDLGEALLTVWLEYQVYSIWLGGQCFFLCGITEVKLLFSIVMYLDFFGGGGVG